LKVGAVILAAGKSEGMGQSRPLRDADGKTIIIDILDALDTSGVSVQVVVLGNNIDAVVEAIRPKLDKVKIALNLTPELGITSSFQTGLVVISGVDAAFLVPNDEAILKPKLIVTMIKKMEDTPGAIIVSPIQNGERGYPLLFRRDVFGEILSLQSLQHIKEILDAHIDKLATVETPE
jgi:molybdenum cofactor cytidylyltransferase